MPNYADSKIYKMECKGLTYIGSTTQPTIAHRLAKHKHNYKYYKNGKYNYVSSFDLFEVGTPTITLLENVCCQTKDQLHARERYWIENNECVNRIIPGRTPDEYAKCQAEYIRVFHETHPNYYNEYYKKNADRQKEYNRKHQLKLKNMRAQCINGTATIEHNEIGEDSSS